MVTTDDIGDSVRAADVERDAQALFEEARRRTRRRRRRQAAVVAGAAAVVSGALVVGLGRDAGSGGGSTGRPEPVQVPAQRVLERAPGAGVACRVPNSIACDRIGLGLRTRRPARSVDATIGGRTFRLDDRTWSERPRRGLRRGFVGFLQPAGLRGLGVRTEGGDHWTGRHPVNLRVRLLVTDANGKRLTTVVTIPLSPGWG